MQALAGPPMLRPVTAAARSKNSCAPPLMTNRVAEQHEQEGVFRRDVDRVAEDAVGADGLHFEEIAIADAGMAEAAGMCWPNAT